MATKGTYPFDLEEYKQFKEQLRDLDGRALDGQVDIARTRQLLQVAVRDQHDSVQFVDRFFQYAHLLLPLDKQLELLREYNKKYWGGVLTEGMFAGVDTTSDHVQRIEDLEVLYVSFGSDVKTFESWVSAIKGENPNFFRGDSLADGYKIRRFTKNTRKYVIGIHRIHINLVAHWDPKVSRSVDDVRAKVKGKPENLAHGEIFAAYGLHSGLLQKTDGINLPYFNGAGYEVKVPGSSSRREAPYGCGAPRDRKVRVDSHWSGFRVRSYSAPVVWE